MTRDPLDSPVIAGDCVEVMRGMPDGSVDAVVTDPPYHLSFMGKAWDHAPTGAESQGMHETWAREALRVLKPGGHMLAFGGTRTFHRLACGIEEAGFEIRDCLTWMYGSGFPKSLNVALAIDKGAGEPDRGRAIPVASTHFPNGRYADEKLTSNPVGPYAPRTPEAAAWNGWGTALKPAWEPIIMARKPLDGSVAVNVLRNGTGALNIDGCRVGFRDSADEAESKAKNKHGDYVSGAHGNKVYGTFADRASGGNYEAPGRWPANLLLSHSDGCVLTGSREVASDGHFPADRGPSGYGSNEEQPEGGLRGQRGLDERFLAGELVETWDCAPGCPVALLDAQSGFSQDGTASGRNRGFPKDGYVGGNGSDHDGPPIGYGGAGGASRFFFTAQSHRIEGCEPAISAEPTSSPGAQRVASAPSDAATAEHRAGKPSSGSTGTTTTDMASASSGRHGSDTRPTPIIASESSPGSPPEGHIPSSGRVKSAATPKPTDITTTTTSRSTSDGSVDAATSSDMPPSASGRSPRDRSPTRTSRPSRRSSSNR